MEEIKSVNPKMLIWARETIGLSKADVSSRFGVTTTIQTITEWEHGDKAPSYAQLKQLARSIYKRPLATFFFPEPPLLKESEANFRHLGIEQVVDLEPDTRIAVREALIYRFNLNDLLEKEIGSRPNTLVRPISFDFNSAEEVAGLVRREIGLTSELQSLWRSTKEAFSQVRELLREKGFYVFLRPFKQESISGLSLYDSQYPVILLNNTRMPNSRKLFTLFHELGHMILGNNGIFFRVTDYIDSLPSEGKRIEHICNAFAAAVLVQLSELSASFRNYNGGLRDYLTHSSQIFKASREVILRRLYNATLISRSDFDTEINILWRSYGTYKDPKTKGGNAYHNWYHYKGGGYIELVMNAYNRGRITRSDAADFLGVKRGSLSKYEDYYYSRH